jgi:hypothetical protein
LRALDDAGAGIESVVEGLCVSIYTQWLGRQSGDSALQERGKEAYTHFTRELEKLSPGSAESTNLGWGIVLAFAGYSQAARPLLDDAADRRAEVALLVMPDDPAERATVLRPFVHASATVFAPALHFYCNALIDLGSIREATKLLNESGLPLSDPLLCGLIGKMCELRAQWSDALKAYSPSEAVEAGTRSSWPAYRYRAALCRTISEGRRDAAGSALDDDLLAKELPQFESEIDQAEIARSAAFINASLLNPTDDWMVRFELGKLSFRRRRYAEADTHLRAALALAPEWCRYPIAELRFTNLTWLTGSSHARDLDMTPEALESSFAALRVSPDAQASAAVRVWTADHTLDRTLLPGEIGDWDPSLQEQAYAIAGNEPEALRCALDAMIAASGHRVLLRLIRRFDSDRFERSADYLLDLGIRESWTSFFALWELADFLCKTRARLSESSNGFARVSQLLVELARRLFELSEFEFQNLIRAYDLFSEMNWQDAAEEVLRRAGRLAEGAAENLAIAVARRKAAGFDPARAGPHGLECLLRAESESRDRLERLQIARELFYYGRAQQARRILDAEGVFSPLAVLQPIEYIVALQCKPWLTHDEHVELAGRACRDLANDFAAGAIERYRDLYKSRLEKVGRIELDSLPVKGRDGSAAASPLYDNPWNRWQTKLKAASNGGVDELKAALDECLDGPSIFAVQFSIWSWVLARWEQALQDASTVPPERKPLEIPISKNPSLDEDGRAIQISDLWRNYLSDAVPAARAKARVQIGAFYAEESRLLQDWEVLRRKAAAPLLDRALAYGQFAVRFLPTLVSSVERNQAHPLLRGLFECVAADCEALARSIEKRLQALEAELADASASNGCNS